MKYTLLLFVLLFSIVSSPVRAEEATPRFLVHLLDYLAKDYAGAVVNGKILIQSEYNEQIEFSDSTIKINDALVETRNNPEIKQALLQLNQLMRNKANAVEVSKLAREIQGQVITIAKLQIAPTQWPSLKRGQKLYAQNCVSCHGANGAGDGPAASGLKPKPANFLDEHMKSISPFQVFNTIRLGVPGTGMPPFNTLSDKETWDLAFYVKSLRANVPAVTAEAATFDQQTLNEVSTSSDEKLKPALLVALRTHSNNDDETGGNSLGIAIQGLDSAVEDYKKGDADSAKNKALNAYLEGIEPIEPRLKASEPAAASALEGRMAAVRGAIEAKKSLGEVTSQVILAKAEIENARKLLQAKELSPWVSFMAALAIILREGFEAVLVIIALLGVIRAAGSRKAALFVHGGWVSALACGAVAWFFSGWLMNISGAQRETLEGSTSLFAVAVLLIVGFWLHSQTEVGRWKDFIHGRVKKALDGKNLFGLFTISFMAVFREAFETVLFLRAIWFEGGEGTRVALLSGVVSSLALVIFLGWLILKFSAKLPIKKLFEASAVMMAGLAVILTGKGVHSFQEIGVVSVNTSTMHWRFDLLGLYPTWETTGSQILIFVLVALLWSYGKKPNPSPKAIQV